MKRIVLLVGIPGCGKTTVAAKLIEKGYLSLNADSIRKQLWGDEGDQRDKEKVFEIFYGLLEQALTKGQDVVIDNTNINARHRQPILERARDAGYQDVQLWIIDTPLDVCLERNRARERAVPEDIVENYYNTLHGSGKPQRSEGKVVVVRPGKAPGDYRFFVVS